MRYSIVLKTFIHYKIKDISNRCNIFFSQGIYILYVLPLKEMVITIENGLILGMIKKNLTLFAMANLSLKTENLKEDSFVVKR